MRRAAVLGVLALAVACGGAQPAAHGRPTSPSVAPQSTQPTATGTPSTMPMTSSTPPPTTRPPTTRPPTTRPPTTAPHTTAPHTTAPPQPTDHYVYVLGDSVLLGAQYTLPAALPGWHVHMDCVGSRRLPQGIEVLRAHTWHSGDTVVIDLGNNYIAGEDGTFGSQIDQAMRVLHAVRRVVWVTVAEKWSSRVTINQAIRAAAGRWPTIRVADWAPIVAAHPSYAYDMLHLSPDGRIAISRLIAARVTGP